MDKESYRERTYRRHLCPAGLATFQVAIRETDLYIAAKGDLTAQALQSIVLYRGHIENYIKIHPAFLTALMPLPEDVLAPPIIRDMLSVSRIAGVGPMAAVAGAIAEYVGRDLLRFTPEVIVENGGDIYLNCHSQLSVGVFAGSSPLSNKLSLKITPQQMPLGICTSSATVGPSVSFGRADAVCVISKSAALADAAASQIGNRVKTKKDIPKALESGSRIPGVRGIVIIVQDHFGAWGEIELS